LLDDLNAEQLSQAVFDCFCGKVAQHQPRRAFGIVGVENGAGVVEAAELLRQVVKITG